MRKNAINLGSDFYIDSFDSTDPAYSTNGKYDPAKKKANGNLASISSAAGQVMVADSKIYGKVYSTATGGYTLGSLATWRFRAIRLTPARFSPAITRTTSTKRFPMPCRPQAGRCSRLSLPVLARKGERGLVSAVLAWTLQPTRKVKSPKH